MSSISLRNVEAARQLVADPSLRPMTEGPEGIFTDLDVLMLAARDASFDGHSFSEHEMRMATREASEAMFRLWRGGKVVRYGPVVAPGLEPDYLRIAGKIVYATPKGPESITTPNGTFPRFWSDEDTLARSGRRLGTARNDLEPWEHQDILGRSTPKQMSLKDREIARLKTELQATQEILETTRAENDRLRRVNAGTRRSAVDPGLERIKDSRLRGSQA